ncbi:hypothetical protein Taro_004564 [Colocasia esculenta]|uniref:Uncharacterized protein n=1 Tax=Colocasia esculenta TaxID=4460 RepID=A0A843TRW5_COLES|nr:hypothetical protein [Colocasia esculenta]
MDQVVRELEQFEPRADSLPQARPTYPRSVDQRMASGAPQRGPMVRSVEPAQQDPPRRPRFLPPWDSTTTIPIPPTSTRPPQGPHRSDGRIRERLRSWENHLGVLVPVIDAIRVKDLAIMRPNVRPRR